MKSLITDTTYNECRRCDHCGDISITYFYNNEFEVLQTSKQVYHYGIGRICYHCLTKINNE